MNGSHSSPTSPEPPERDPRLLLLAAGEESALPARERRALLKAATDDPAVAAQMADLQADMSLLGKELRGSSDATSAAAVDRAAREAKRAMRAWKPSPAVAGRIGAANAMEADAASQAWRWARWPLAAAAVLVAGLVGLSQIQAPTHSLDSRVALNNPGDDGYPPGMGLADGGGMPTQTESLSTNPDGSADLDEFDELDESAQQLASLFEQPSFVFEDDDETLGWSEELESLDQLASLETPEMADWSAFEADG